jgi:PQQ-dependent dehydrogenase (s-GDH family)
MVMGPDDSLWVTERRGYVTKINPTNGGKKQVLNIAGLVRFTTTGSGTSLGISQDGMFGIALHPDLIKGTGFNFVYLAYCYDSVGFRRTKIVRYTYDRATQALNSELTLLSGIWGSNDHNGGRLVIADFGVVGTPNYKLFYSVGDQGANQFGNACDSIESQYTPTAAQMTAHDLHRYCGKVLRLNLDGSIPTDNPVINGVKSHVWSYGHRNPQGLTLQKDINNQLVPNGRLYESEQGPATNDEINIIDSANNYGWPRVAGKQDDNWYKYYKWSTSVSPACGSYSSECSSTQTNNGLPESSFSAPRYTNPIFDLYPGTPPLVGGAPNTCNWLTYPTIAPSSVIYYPYNNKIPGWNNCLLITTLKTSSMFRLKLSADGSTSQSVSDSVIPYFKTAQLNRFRDIALGTDGITMYILTDSVGGTSGPSAGSDGGVTDRGSVLEYKYTGAVLAIGSDPVNPTSGRLNFRMYPNPVATMLTVESKRNMAKPLRYQLYDAAGKIILTGTSIKDKFEVNVSRVQHGMYILKVFNGYSINVATEKVVVN